jgi:hypothetical protein
MIYVTRRADENGLSSWVVGGFDDGVLVVRYDKTRRLKKEFEVIPWFLSKKPRAGELLPNSPLKVLPRGNR